MDYFVLTQGRVSVRGELTMWTILRSCLQRVSAAFGLAHDQDVLFSDELLHKLLESIFDADMQAFLAEGSSAMLSRLGDEARARMLVQAIAGLTCIFSRLDDATTEVTQERLDRELGVFAGSERRSAVMENVRRSTLFGNCYTKSQIADLIVEAVESADGNFAITPTEETELAISWATDLPPRTMGVPWGLTIMALN
jgi:hypothetical protein